MATKAVKTAAADAARALAPTIHANFNSIYCGIFSLVIIVCTNLLLSTLTVASSGSSILAKPHTSNLYLRGSFLMWNDFLTSPSSTRVSSSSTVAVQAVPQQ
jgi:hypothetical protein